jgi:YD repeat-containing protein
LEAKKLDNIVFKDQTLTSVETYSFDYYPVKYPGTDKAMNVRYLDMWGYYNAHGCSGNCILIDQCPFIPNTDGTAVINNPNNDRVSDEDAMKSGVLSKITYPTGGYTEFFYQMNKYKDQATVKDGSGLRIYQIKSTDGNNHTLLKTYKYGSNECGYGDLPLIPTSTAMKSTFEKWLLLNDIAISTTINTKETETDYFSNILPVLSYIANLPVFYTYVTEYQGDETNNVGKILYTYSQGNTSPLSSMPMAPSSYQLWKKSNLLQADFYTKTNNPSNPYSLVKTSKNTYTETTYPSETIDGLWIKRNYFIVPPLGDQDETVSCGQPIIENNPYLCPNSTCPCIADFWYAVNQNLPIYFYSDYTIEVGKNELTGTTETISTDAGDFTTTISYTYNANHLLSNKTIKSSKNENISTDIKYPFDYSGNTVLSQMVTLNMLNFPVEQIEKKDNTFLQSTKTNYNFFQRSTVNIAPSSIDVTHGSNAPETRLRYLNYDNKGNILSQSKENDVIQSYIWGYNQTLPIVKAENIDYTTLYRAFSSALSTAQIINFSEITVPSLDADQKAKLKAFNTALQGNAGLAKAMITTYTYTPLIGMTSSTAPNGVTTYYEYDDFGRLKCIRDDDGHILKTYEYHYKP